MKMTRYIVAMGAMLLYIGGIKGQNLEESLTVEGTYTPEVISADRLSATPATLTLSAPESNLNYDRRGVTANFAPDALAMPAMGWRTDRLFDTSRGYLNLSLGSWLNASLSAGFAAIRNEDTRLNVWLDHNSTSLWRAWEADLEKGFDDAASHRFRYDERIGADLRHKIANAGTLTAGLQYHFGHFNYYGTNFGTVENQRIVAPTQTLNDIHAHAGWKGKTSTPLSYRVDADVRYFGYDKAYIKTYKSPDFFSSMMVETLEEGKGLKETTVNMGGNIGYSFSGGSGLSAELQYSGVLNSIGNDVNRVKLTPAYEYSRDNMSLRVGAELALVSAENTRFRVAPDVRFGIRSGIGAFSARIGGGTHLRTLAYLHQMDYYGNPLAGCHDAAYSPIDASIAFQLNPGGKWTFGIDGAWRTTLHETFGGLYQAYLNGLPDYGDEMTRNRIHGFSIGVNAGYEFSRYFGLKGDFHWQPQNGTAGYLNGFDRPEITVNAEASSKPIDPLTLSLCYELRAKRYLLHGNISRLNFSAGYKVNEKISIGAELCNLLNRHEYILPDLPTEGFTAAGVVKIKF